MQQIKVHAFEGLFPLVWSGDRLIEGNENGCAHTHFGCVNTLEIERQLLNRGHIS